MVEAAVMVSSLQARRAGSRRRHDGIPWAHIGAVPGNDVRGEAAALVLVRRAIRRSGIVREVAGRPPGRMTLPGRVAERVARQWHSANRTPRRSG